LGEKGDTAPRAADREAIRVAAWPEGDLAADAGILRSSAMPEAAGYQKFFAELKRRRVFRVIAVYGAVAFVVLQVADIAFPGLGLPPWALTLVLALILLGFPIAVVLAWAFEMTPGGVKRTEAAAPGEITAIVSEPAQRRWPAGLLALAGIAALMAGAWWVGRSSAPAGEGAGIVRAASANEILDVAYADLAGDTRPSVGVLPFADLSPEGDQVYFADGMSEELLNALAKVRALRVAGRTSSFAYRNVEKDLREIGEELGVQYLVEGSVRKQGARLRITAQLVDAEDNFHLWSETYDRTLDDVFAVQEEIAGAIAEALKVSLGVDDGDRLVAPTGDIGAYEIYLTARARMRERGQGVPEAVRLFEAVVARDSTWAPGWAGLAQAHSLVPYYLPRELDEDEEDAIWRSSLDAAEAAAERALSLDPRSAGGEVALGNVLRDRWQWQEAEAHYVRALEIDPDDVEAHQQYAEHLAAMGRLDEALRSARRAVALDPTSAIRLNVLGYILAMNGRPQESIPQFELAVLHGPDLFMAWGNLARVQRQLGRIDEAERTVREEILPRFLPEGEERAEADRTAAAAFAAFRARDPAALEACCESTGRRIDAARWLVVGDTARAIEALREAASDLPEYGYQALYIVWSSELDAIRDDPRVREIHADVLERAVLSDAVLRRAAPGE